QAYRSLRSRPLESVLLILTIMFGVALSGLVLTAAWPGLGSTSSTAPGLDGRELTVQLRDQDYGQFYNTPNAPPVARVGRVGDKPIIVSETDLGKFKASAPAVKAAYVTEESNMGDWDKGRAVRAVSSEYFGALGATLVKGALFGAADYREQRPVVILTEYGAKFLFPKKSALGQSVAGFRVIGIMKVPEADKFQFRSPEQPQYAPLGLIPYGAKVKEGDIITSPNPLSALHFVAQLGQTAEALSQLSFAAQKRWGERVSVSSNAQQGAEYSKQFRRAALTLALLGVGGLFVASLSVLALMLARMLSRQRQLGMAAALGASRGRLRSQYLLEVLVLGVLGSVLGGLTALGLVFWLTRSSSGMYGYTLDIQPVALIVTVLASVVLCVLFGLVPAIQASKVRPSEALRA
ncbi:ABC transporter permease, partial [Deinococcus sp.]|uniref:ABC transporter permease n=1 Tax=Deinococcus sp. TaxID=47478 RepID=UPI0025D4E305